MPTTLLAIIFIASLAGIVFIIARHFSAVSTLRPEALTHIRHQQLKADLLLVRFNRFVIEPIKRFFRAALPWSQQFGKRFYRLLNILKTLEHHYEKIALQKQRTATNTTTLTEGIDRLLVEAQAFYDKKLFDDAERKYIAAIALDAKSLAAYEGLGELYFEKKDYDAARETYAHIVKLNERSAAAHARLGAIASASGNLAEAEQDYAKAAELANDLVSSHIDLGVVHQAMGKHEEALVNFLKARELEPKNPRVLDLLLDTAIVLGKSSLAEETLLALAEANPENQKLDELRDRVAAISEEQSQTRKKK